MPRDELVQHLEHAARKQGEGSREPTGAPHLLEHGDAAATEADERSVPQDDAPAREPLVRPEHRQMLSRLGVVQRQERKLVVPVERGDDPRRPSAESSPAVVEQDRPLRVH
jgi:hypothetical protein